MEETSGNDTMGKGGKTHGEDKDDMNGESKEEMNDESKEKSKAADDEVRPNSDDSRPVTFVSIMAKDINMKMSL